jgi:hypothetical protein
MASAAVERMLRWTILIAALVTTAVGCGEGIDVMEVQLTGAPVPAGSRYRLTGVGLSRGDDGGAPLYARRDGEVDASGRFEVALPDLKTWVNPDLRPEDNIPPTVRFRIEVDIDADGQVCPGDLVPVLRGPEVPPYVTELPEVMTFEMEAAPATWPCRPLVPE